jgi:hypothetical protein
MGGLLSFDDETRIARNLKDAALEQPHVSEAEIGEDGGRFLGPLTTIAVHIQREGAVEVGELVCGFGVLRFGLELGQGHIEGSIEALLEVLINLPHIHKLGEVARASSVVGLIRSVLRELED